MKHSHKQIFVKSLFVSGYLDIRPLEYFEIQNLLVLARKKGFYANDELHSYLIDCAVLNEGEKINNDDLDIFLKFNIAREAWLVTLAHIEKNVHKLRTLIEEDALLKITIKKVKSYKYKELASPGLLWLIKKDMEKVNVDLYVNEIIYTIVPAIKTQGKELKGVAKEKEINKKLEGICNMILSKNHIDTDLHNILPAGLFSIRERFYISMQLAETLNWKQYVTLTIGFNHCVENLNLQSNRLGGIDTDKGVLISGLPLSFDLFQYPKTLPLYVVASLAKDIFYKNSIPLSRHYSRKVKKAFDEAISSIARNKNKKDLGKESFFFEFINDFASRIPNNELLRYKICFCYWDEFSSSLKEYIDKSQKNFLLEYSINNIPDCYMLVEGVSEEICFKKFVNILNDGYYFIKVLNCNSKSGVYSKYRDVINNESYIGAIVTVLDSDATYEQAMIKKIKLNHAVAANYIYEFGEFEDLFPVKLHINVIKNIFLDGKSVSVKDFDSEKPLANQLKRIFWQKHKSSFDKKIYAEKLAEAISDKSEIPELAQQIIIHSIKLAKKQSGKFKKPTVHSIDAMSNKLDSLIETLL